MVEEWGDGEVWSWQEEREMKRSEKRRREACGWRHGVS